jgi:hypothetical protein
LRTTKRVPPRLDLEKRHDPAVDAVHVPVEFLNLPSALTRPREPVVAGENGRPVSEPTPYETAKIVIPSA